MTTRRLLAATAATCLTASALAAETPPAPPPPAPKPAKTAGAEDITVTATRRSSAISRVPVSITAFSQATLDAKGARDITDVVRFTPGVTFDPVTNNVSIRGISSEAGAGTTGLYIDDTPVQVRNLGFNAENTLPELFDLQRIEILRGPQGTLFGAGSEGGTVRYITPPPGLTAFTSYARASVSASPDGAPTYDLGYAVGGPIIADTLGFRLSASHEYDGGYLDHVNYQTNAITARDTNSNDVTTLRAALAYQPFAGLVITPAFFLQQRLKGDTDAYFVGLSNPSKGVFRTNSPEYVRDNDRFFLPSLNAHWDLNGISVISNTSWLHRNNLTGYNGTIYNLSYYDTLGPDPAYAPLLLPTGINPALPFYISPSRITNEQRNFTQEVRVQSNDTDPRFNWVAGVFYEYDRQLSSEEIQDPYANNLFIPVFGQTIEEVLEAPLYGKDSYINRTSSIDKQVAGFADGTLRLFEGVKLDGGVRVAHASFAFDNFAAGSQNGGTTSGNGGTSETPVTGKATLSWQITPRTMVYAGWASGYREGGANAPVPTGVCAQDFRNLGITAAPASYASDTVSSFEIGAKDRFLEGRVQLSASAFTIDWNNIQQDVPLPICGLQYTGNLGKAVSRGFDLQATIRPVTTVTLDTTLSFTDTHYATSVGDPNAGLVVRAGDTIGDPAWKFSLGAQYDVPQNLLSPWDGAAYLRADYQYAGPPAGTTTLLDPQSASYDRDYYRTDPSNDISLRAGVTFPNGVNAAVFVNNLLNATPTLTHLHETADSALFYNTTLRPLYAGLEVTLRR